MTPACSSMGTEPLKCRRHPAGLSPVQTHGPFLFGCFKAAPVPLSTSLRNVQSERQGRTEGEGDDAREHTGKDG